MTLNRQNSYRNRHNTGCKLMDSCRNSSSYKALRSMVNTLQVHLHTHAALVLEQRKQQLRR